MIYVCCSIVLFIVRAQQPTKFDTFSLFVATQSLFQVDVLILHVQTQSLNVLEISTLLFALK